MAGVGEQFGPGVVKTPAEVECILKAMRRTEAALDAAINAIREAEIVDGTLRWRGKVLTSEALKRLIAAHLLDDGLLAQHTIVACGDAACDPHNEGAGPLRAGGGDHHRHFPAGRGQPILR